ncbi:hypothetical protein J3458_013464 [Metarhizium acridum]|uniref:uncharacterized protein n=1 Tax=Metarhizium acridum TaxID=92637 RepID=UPI001C6AE5BD|nr:hypothetical protein J3458_013464 [Metarhizium acridum]
MSQVNVIIIKGGYGSGRYLDSNPGFHHPTPELLAHSFDYGVKEEKKREKTTRTKHRVIIDRLMSRVRHDKSDPSTPAKLATAKKRKIRNEKGRNRGIPQKILPASFTLATPLVYTVGRMKHKEVVGWPFLSLFQFES